MSLPTTLPTAIYLDTSIVLAALIRGIPHAAASVDFCGRLADQGTHVYFSQLLRFELIQAFRGLAIAGNKNLPADLRQQFNLDQWSTSARVRRQWLRFCLSQLDGFLSFFDAIELPITITTWRRSVTIVQQRNLKSYDALHLATAREHRVMDFATTDREFRGIRAPRVWLVRDA